MVFKSYVVNHHLTSAGWNTKDIPPSHRVETWRLAVVQEHGWSKERRSWTCTWYNEDWSEAERDKLREKFPPPV